MRCGKGGKTAASGRDAGRQRGEKEQPRRQRERDHHRTKNNKGTQILLPLFLRVFLKNYFTYTKSCSMPYTEFLFTTSNKFAWFIFLMI